MPDIPGNSTTTASITIGGTANDVLEVVGDHDWFRIQLTAGQKITITVDGLTLEDPLVRILNSGGTVLGENDDISSGVVRDSKLVFTAPSTGTYYVDVGAFDDDYSGTYQLAVNLYVAPSAATIDTIAQHLTDGYWGGDRHHFNVTQGGTITYDFNDSNDPDGVTASGQSAARDALALWSDITGVNFVQVASGGQITFTDNEEGAFTDGTWSQFGITSSMHVNVSSQWLNSYGSIAGTYGFQTYIHEIGHALGLGHGGYYNNTADYGTDAEFANDGWPTTVMSYFDQVDNTYFANQGFTFEHLSSPMVADVRAMADLYGLSTTTRTGDTTYGFGNTSGRAIYSANLDTISSYTIVDSGGTDTLNYSGFESNQAINLNPETFSNVGAGFGNVSIGFGTVIENAIGGGGNDVLTGNGANNALTGNGGNDTILGGVGADTLTGGFGIDILTGGTGNDIFRDSKSGLNGDTITDFSVGDSIVLTDATLAGFTFNLSGSTLSFTGGSLTLTGFAGQLTASAAAGGGVQLAVGAAAINDVRNDFNGDGRSDILWRNTDGTLTDWLANANATFASNHAVATYGLDLNWTVAGSGDFNGDGRDDVLLRHANGTVTDWLGQANGSFVSNHAVATYALGTEWTLAGTGDFNGDGRDDILWRNNAGAMSQWLGQANGAFAYNPNAAYQLPTNWEAAATGDFNGDGRDDILWRNEVGAMSEWLGQANGTFAYNPNAAYQLPTNWELAATGDFNGDGRDDILWRNEVGAMSQWLAQANGTFVYNANAAYSLPTNWEVGATGDFNGDGRDDILWRNEVGAMSQWLANADATFAYNPNAAYQLPASWQAQPDVLV